ncbi:heme ABC exporter ATP-binding protein CcmA [Sneathiella sp.]|uniref:heme ABC exporter ATP-binding protein CcmA n=1 Tax=Sneathiella sp. TaxID=1964365 RepID=UPI002622C9AB|nr:heme ABC exporter ATP-binding protein CcmA [Sneathiella sp.]MDF2366374.1 heme ABC exporter ATP-binding protein CcmA [Sneathiella sp.]
MSFVAQNLACQRADQLIFKDVSFSLSPGEAIWVKGRNGAGKSSLLRICARLLSPLSGHVEWQGEDIFKDDDIYIGEYHYLGHLDALKHAFTVRENIEFWASFHGSPNVDFALEQFELQALADMPAGMLSQGQKKRTNLARLVASPAKLWILDEPLSALDQQYIALFRERLRRHLAEGGMALFATHQDIELEPVNILNLDETAL